MMSNNREVQDEDCCELMMTGVEDDDVESMMTGVVDAVVDGCDIDIELLLKTSFGEVSTLLL